MVRNERLQIDQNLSTLVGEIETKMAEAVCLDY